MSRLTHPVGSQQQSCFCCPPVRETYGSSSEERGRHPVVTSLTRLDNQIPLLSSNTAQVDTNSITDLISNFHLENQGSYASLNDSPLTPHPHVQIDTLQGQSCDLKVNMQALQSRQIGVSLHNRRKFKSASGMPVLHPEPSGSCMEAAPTAGSIMDLDLALDELGMLSTVTNSRRQYLLESNGQASPFFSREKRLQKKSRSSPNLASLSRLSSLRIIQLDSNYVTNVSCDKHESSPDSTVPFSQPTDIPLISQSYHHHQYRDPQLLEAAAIANRRRSVPRMSRLRKDRYMRSRCPYKIPYRLCHSMQEADFGPDYFTNCPPRPSSIQSSSPLLTSSSQKIQEATVKPSTYQSKSNGTSPAKVHQEQNMTRSHSVEDLLSVQRRLEFVFDNPNMKETEAHLDQIATQFTDLHMS